MNTIMPRCFRQSGVPLKQFPIKWLPCVGCWLQPARPSPQATASTCAAGMANVCSHPTPSARATLDTPAPIVPKRCAHMYECWRVAFAAVMRLPRVPLEAAPLLLGRCCTFGRDRRGRASQPRRTHCTVSWSSARTRFGRFCHSSRRCGPCVLVVTAVSWVCVAWQGSCNTVTGSCNCDEGYTGIACDKRTERGGGGGTGSQW